MTRTNRYGQPGNRHCDEKFLSVGMPVSFLLFNICLRKTLLFLYSTLSKTPTCLPDSIFHAVGSTKLLTGWYILHRGKYQTVYRLVYSTPWKVPNCSPDGIFYAVGSTKLFTGWYILRRGKYQTVYRLVYSTPWKVPNCLPVGIFYTVGSTKPLAGWYILRRGKHRSACASVYSARRKAAKRTSKQIEST